MSPKGPGVAGIITATTVVLPAGIWKAELEAELVRLGVPIDRAPASAAHVLHRIVGHHGWPCEAIGVAEADPPASTEGAQP